MSTDVVTHAPFGADLQTEDQADDSQNAQASDDAEDVVHDIALGRFLGCHGLGVLRSGRGCGLVVPGVVTAGRFGADGAGATGDEARLVTVLPRAGRFGKSVTHRAPSLLLLSFLTERSGRDFSAQPVRSGVPAARKENQGRLRPIQNAMMPTTIRARVHVDGGGRNGFGFEAGRKVSAIQRT